MGSTKRVQPSISSFFKPKDGKSTPSKIAPTADTTAANGSRQIIPAARKRRRIVDSDDEYQGEPDVPSDDDADQDYENRSENRKLRKGTNGNAQSKGRTMTKSVSDTVDLMERLRMRAKTVTAPTRSIPNAMEVLPQPGTLESTSVQLVKRKPGIKYTPLEVQVLDAKQKHPDMLLAVEVGYKYRFFGEDARIASQVLGIMCTVANNFYNASIPTPRLMIHVRRLVFAGYKVGILRQTETAALKAVSDNKNAPFTRQLADVFTLGTMVEEVGNASDNGVPSERYLMSIVEDKVDFKDNRVSISMLAVQVTTGNISYDQFDDGYLRSSLETRLAHLQPGEILIPQNLTTETLRTLSAYVGYQIGYNEQPEPLLEHANRAGTRVAFADSELSEPAAARSFSIDFYTQHKANALLSTVLDLPESVIVALAALIRYLQPFKLDRALLTSTQAGKSKQLFVPFHTQMHMLLSATALQTLGVFQADNSGGSSKEVAVQLKELLKPGGRSGGMHSMYMRGGDGSLFSVMDFTRSQFGRRCLRRWIAHPLVSQDSLRDRTDAVEFLKHILDSDGNAGSGDKKVLAGLHNKIGQLVDLERGLCRIHYGQASPQELLRILQSLDSAASLVPQGFELSQPRLLAELLSSDTWTNELRDCILSWRGQIDYASAKSGRKETMFKHGPLFDQVQQHHQAIESIENELQTYAEVIRNELRDASFEFKSISGTDFLIDIKNTRARTAPDSWIKISSTKTNSRFHTPFIIDKLAEREQHRELLQQAAKDSYAMFLRQISDKYAMLRQMVSALATVDALFSLAILARQQGYCRPELVDSEASVDLVAAVNPIIGTNSAVFVANDIKLGTEESRAMILSGPNAGGKSTLIRTVALISIMAQCGSYVPAQSARLSIIDGIFTRMGASDNLMAGESTFMVEMRETAELLCQVTPRSLAILDELGRGTSTHDGAAIAFAVLDYLVQKRPLTFFVTHYTHLVDAFAKTPLVCSCHMAFMENRPKDRSSSGQDITFLYKLAEGASADSFGINVARLAGLPESLLLNARERARWMRQELDSNWAAKCARKLQSAVAKARKV
ncbi:Mismatch repair protein msh3 [Coemansia sp. RSA 989]|nr:Mismatch repair protein msh3 [Coemansia sp. RSA 989]